MSDQPDRPHDTFFKETFADVKDAAAELRSVLPAEVVGLLRWETLRLESGNFEVANDRNRFCDLLFSCDRSVGGGAVLVYVLFEHQSTDDPTMPLRMLRTMVRIWDRWLETKRGLPLPPILPVALSHDERGWRSARRFSELFQADEGTRTLLGRFVPDFEMVVDDIARVSDRELDARGLSPQLALSLWALRDGRSPKSVLSHAPFWARIVAALDGVPGGVEAMLRILRYLGEAAGGGRVDLEQLATVLAEHSPNAEQLAMNSLERLLEKGRQEGLEQGREQGLAKGRVQGQRETLRKQLRAKFAELSEADVARIEQADGETLERYLERVLTADSVTAVLGE